MKRLTKAAFLGFAFSVPLGAFTGVQAQPAPAQPDPLSRARIECNPLRPGCQPLRFQNLPAGTRLRVYSFIGELVKDFNADGSGQVSWDGTDQNGRPAGGGVYSVFVESGGTTRTFQIGIKNPAATQGPAAQNSSLPEHGSRPARLDDAVARFHADDRSIAAALAGSADSTDDAWLMGLNLGFIYTHDPARDLRGPIRIRIDRTGASVRDVLDALTSADTNYSWVQDGTAIDFVPFRPEPQSIDVSSILEQTLPSFTVDNETMIEAVASLIEQAQAQGVTGLSGPQRPRASREVEGWFSDEEKISLSLTGKTVRQCLNAIIAADSPAEWMAFPRGKIVKITATPKHAHHYYHRDLSAQEAADLKKKYPEPPPRRLQGGK